MKYVPVVSSTGKPLMPCHAARARELIRKGRAIRRFNKGIFYIKLLDRDKGEVQPVALGIDPGSKREGFTLKSKCHTFLNIQASAVDWVSKKVEERKILRKTRRSRKTPYRSNRQNRSRGGIPPSTKARWQLKLRILWWLSYLYPISTVVVEDIVATVKQGNRNWNSSFSPLQVGKNWFYDEIEKRVPLITFKGWETYQERQILGLKKSKDKLANKWDSHCVDSWTLSNMAVGGHTEPDNKTVLFLYPIKLHRRNLHRQQPSKGGERKRYGSTRSLGFKRGSWVKHLKWGVCYVGGSTGNRISIHSMFTGKRITDQAKPTDCKILCFSSWRLVNA